MVISFQRMSRAQRTTTVAEEVETWDIDGEFSGVRLDPIFNRHTDQLADSVRALWEMDVGDQTN